MLRIALRTKRPGEPAKNSSFETAAMRPPQEEDRLQRFVEEKHHGYRIHRPGKNGLPHGPPPDRGQTSARGLRPTQGGRGQTGCAWRASGFLTEGCRRPRRDGAGELALAAGLA